MDIPIVQTIRNHISSWLGPTEPFQGAPQTTPPAIEEAKEAIRTFFSWWKTVPLEFQKSDVQAIVTKWAPYTTKTDPYIAPSFAALDAPIYQTLVTEFTKAYTLSLLDVYAALKTRHTSAPLKTAPFRKPSPAPVSVSSDRLLVQKGDTSLLSFYKTSFLPALFKVLQQQLIAVFKTIEGVLQVSSEAEQEAATRLLPSWKEDQTMVAKATFEQLFAISDMYLDYKLRARQYLPGGEKYDPAEEVYRATLKSRIDSLNTRYDENVSRDTNTLVARAGIPIPKEFRRFPLSTQLNFHLLQLMTLEHAYFGPKGLEIQLNRLIQKAVLETKRSSVETLLSTFQSTYRTVEDYCTPSLTKELIAAKDLLPTYWKDGRQKSMADLPLGTLADRSSTEIKSLFALEGRYLTAFQSLVLLFRSCFLKFRTEKSGLQRQWSPHTSVLETREIPKQLDVKTLEDLRDSYIQLWIYAEQAARKQLQDQYTVYTKLHDLAQLIGVSVNPKVAFPTLPVYNLQPTYTNLERDGTNVLDLIRQWLLEQMREYEQLYNRYTEFQKLPSAASIVPIKSIESSLLQNTTQADSQTLQSYTFYTPNLPHLMGYQWVASYTVEPSGKYPRLRRWVQSQLLEFVEAFLQKWNSLGMAQPYPTYEADVGKLKSASIETEELQKLLDRYTRYTQKSENLDTVEEFAASVKEFKAQTALFESLYIPNEDWLPTVPPSVLQATQLADSTDSLSQRLSIVTTAVRDLFQYLQTYIPTQILLPNRGLCVMYETFQFTVPNQPNTPISGQSIEKERLLLASFLEPTPAFRSWLDRFRTKVASYEQLQSFVRTQIESYIGEKDPKPPVTLGNANELRDTLQDLKRFADQDLKTVKSRTFQQISDYFKVADTSDPLYARVQTVLAQIQETDDRSFILLEEYQYRLAVMQIEARKEVRNLLDAIETQEYTEVYAEFVKANQDRIFTLPSLEGDVRTAFRGILQSYILQFWPEYQALSSRTRDVMLPYTNSEWIEDQRLQNPVALAKKYTELTSWFHLAEQQEKALQSIDTFLDRLYTPNSKYVQEKPIELMKLAFTANGARWTAKTKPSETDIPTVLETLVSLTKTYDAATQEWSVILRKEFTQDLTAFATLYNTYQQFDTVYSNFFDLEPIPSELQIHVQEDLQALNLESLEFEMAVNTIRERYYFYPDTSQFPLLVRFIKIQLYLFLQKYEVELEKLETALRPPSLPTDLIPRVYPPSYSQGDLQTLVDIVKDIEKGASDLQTQQVLQSKKDAVRTQLDTLEELKGMFKDTSKLAINEQQIRIDLEYASKKEEIDVVYEQLSAAFAKLTMESLRLFQISYIQNKDLRSYLYKNAVDVLNAFTTYYQQDAETVPLNAPEVNNQICRAYLNRIQILKDAQGTAVTLQDSTEEYRAATLARIQEVEAIQEELQIVSTSDVKQVVQDATYMHEIEPTRKAYDQIYRDLYSQITQRVETRIQEWKTAYTAYGPFVKFLPKPPPIPDLTGKSVDALLFFEKQYTGYLASLKKTQASFLSKVRLSVQSQLQSYQGYLDQLKDLSGISLPSFQDADLTRISKEPFEGLLALSTTYKSAEDRLLIQLSEFAISYLNAFVMNNKTLLVPDYAVPRERAMYLIPLLESRSISIPMLIQELQLYGSLLARLDSSLQSLEIQRLLDQLDVLIKQVHSSSIDVPTKEQLLVERSRIRTLPVSELTNLRDLYTSYIYSIQSQFLSQVATTLQEFENLYLQAETEETLLEFGDTFQTLYATLEVARKITDLEKAGQIQKKYAEAIQKANQVRSNILSRRQIETRAQWKEQQTKRLDASGAMERYMAVYSTYKDTIEIPDSLRILRDTTTDLKRIRETLSREELERLRLKYVEVTTRLLQIVEETQKKQAETVRVLVERFQSLYLPHLAILHSFPSYLRLDVRMIDRDIDTLRGVPSVETIQALNTKYTNYMTAFTKQLTDMGVTVGESLIPKKQEARRLIQQMNQLFLAFTAQFQEFPVEVRRTIRGIPNDLQYLDIPTLTTEEVDRIIQTYTSHLRLLRDSLEDIAETAENTTLLPTLDQLRQMFLERYAMIDATRIPVEKAGFLQGLREDNPQFRTNAQQAIELYRQGIQVLDQLPKTSERRLDNPDFQQLQEAIGYFQKEYGIRDVTKFIPNDRLLLNGLRNDAQAYLNLYRTPAPNMQNYTVLVQQVAKQYWEGLRILRSYPINLAAK